MLILHNLIILLHKKSEIKIKSNKYINKEENKIEKKT